ncbi:hypothetical protein KKG46_03895 [Patescibacteria group bacterium]|nr:hypothetical protein [Patescibacteria group bacterium]
MPENNYVGRGFTEGELKAAGWWVRNEVKIHYWSRMTLYVLNGLIWVYVGWGLLDAYAISYPRESRITQEIAANQQILDRLQQDRPENVGTSQVLVFTATEDRQDIMVDVQNPNKDWWAEFSYSFNVSGEQTPSRQGFVMPDSLVTLTELGFKPTKAGARSAQLQVDNIRWHRVEPSDVGGNYSEFINRRFGGVTVQNVLYDQGTTLNGKLAPKTSFVIQNQGAYGYWSIDYVVKLLRGNTVVAVNKINVRDLKPGESRPVELYWYDQLPSVNKTEVTPIINLLDPNSFLPTDRL